MTARDVHQLCVNSAPAFLLELLFMLEHESAASLVHKSPFDLLN